MLAPCSLRRASGKRPVCRGRTPRGEATKEASRTSVFLVPSTNSGRCVIFVRSQRQASAAPWSKRHWRAALALAFVLLLGPAGGVAQEVPGQTEQAWRIDPAAFRATVNRICVLPVVTPEPIPKENGEEVRKMVARRLEWAGYQVDFPSEDEATALWREAAQQAGGVFDIHFGWIDDDRLRAAERAFAQLLEQRHGCQAHTEIQVAVVTAPIQMGLAKWDGYEVLIDQNVISGWVRVLSLWLRVFDQQGAEVYFLSGGIEPVAEKPKRLFSLEMERKEAAQLLGSTVLNLLAADRVVQPFAQAAK